MAETVKSTAYADLLSALLALRADPATARFDAELAEAEAAGALDGATARTLAWWQRESLRGVADHLATVLPDLLGRLAESDDAARASVDSSASSWSAATATHAAPVGPPVATSSVPDEPRSGSHLRPVEDVRSSSAPPGPPGAPGAVRGLPSPLDPGARHLAPALRPGFAPAPSAAPTSEDPAAHGAPDATPPAQLPGHGAPPRRLLVAGLTVLNEPVEPVHPEPAGAADGEARGDEPAKPDERPDDSPNDDPTHDAR